MFPEDAGMGQVPARGSEDGLGSDAAGMGPGDDHDGAGDWSDAGHREQVRGDLEDQVMELFGVRRGVDAEVQGVAGQPGGLGSGNGDVDGLTAAGTPGRDGPQLADCQGLAGINAQLHGPHQRGQRVHRCGPLLGHHLPRKDQYSQRIADTISSWHPQCTGVCSHH